MRLAGLAGDPPGWFGRDEDIPRAVHAGPWIAQHGQFFDGWGRRADTRELPALAAAQAARSGWAKVIGDWGPATRIQRRPFCPRRPGVAAACAMIAKAF